MQQKEPSTLTDQELLAEAKKVKSASILSALLIGFMIGIIIYSILTKSIGIFTLIPLYFIYKMFNNPKNKEHNTTVKALVKERGLS